MTEEITLDDLGDLVGKSTGKDQPKVGGDQPKEEKKGDVSDDKIDENLFSELIEDDLKVSEVLTEETSDKKKVDQPKKEKKDEETVVKKEETKEINTSDGIEALEGDVEFDHLLQDIDKEVKEIKETSVIQKQEKPTDMTDEKLVVQQPNGITPPIQGFISPVCTLDEAVSTFNEFERAKQRILKNSDVIWI